MWLRSGNCLTFQSQRLCTIYLRSISRNFTALERFNEMKYENKTKFPLKQFVLTGSSRMNDSCEIDGRRVCVISLVRWNTWEMFRLSWKNFRFQSKHKEKKNRETSVIQTERVRLYTDPFTLHIVLHTCVSYYVHVCMYVGALVRIMKSRASFFPTLVRHAYLCLYKFVWPLKAVNTLPFDEIV